MRIISPSFRPIWFHWDERVFWRIHFPTCSNTGPETGSRPPPGRRFEPTNPPRASDRATAGPASRIHGPCFFPYFESFESVPGREILDISRRLTQEACKPLIFLKVLSRNDDESDGMAVTDWVGPPLRQGGSGAHGPLPLQLHQVRGMARLRVRSPRGPLSGLRSRERPHRGGSQGDKR